MTSSGTDLLFVGILTVLSNLLDRRWLDRLTQNEKASRYSCITYIHDQINLWSVPASAPLRMNWMSATSSSGGEFPIGTPSHLIYHMAQ